MLCSIPRILRKSVCKSEKEDRHKIFLEKTNLFLHAPREHRKRRGAQKAKTLRDFVMSHVMDDFSSLLCLYVATVSQCNSGQLMQLMKQTNKFQKYLNLNIWKCIWSRGRFHPLEKQRVPRAQPTSQDLLVSIVKRFNDFYHLCMKSTAAATSGNSPFCPWCTDNERRADFSIASW